MGFDIHYQAVPEEIVDYARSDRGWIESLAILPLSIGNGSHERPRRPSGPRPDDAFWERVQATFRETPGLASRRFDVGLWDQLHWALSAERRRGRFWIVDLVEPAPPDDLGTWAVRGEVVIPESVGVPDARIRLNRAPTVRAIAEWLSQVTRADLEAGWQADVMATVPFYKGPSAKTLVALFPHVCELVEGLTSFYSTAAEWDEAVLVEVVWSRCACPRTSTRNTGTPRCADATSTAAETSRRRR